MSNFYESMAINNRLIYLNNLINNLTATVNALSERQGPALFTLERQSGTPTITSNSVSNETSSSCNVITLEKYASVF